MTAPRADRDKIIDLALAGKTPLEISEQLGVDANAVSCLLAYERRKGTPIPRFRQGAPIGRRRFVIVDPPKGLRAAYMPAAEARGLNVSELVGELLRVIAREKLVDAILDDGGRDA